MLKYSIPGKHVLFHGVQWNYKIWHNYLQWQNGLLQKSKTMCKLVNQPVSDTYSILKYASPITSDTNRVYSKQITQMIKVFKS